MVETIAFASERNGGKTLGPVQSGVSPTGREAAYLNLSFQLTPRLAAPAKARRALVGAVPEQTTGAPLAQLNSMLGRL